MLGITMFYGFYTVTDFPPFLCGLYINVKSGLYCITFLGDVKTEHLIIFSCIKDQFKAIMWCHIILSGLEGHVGKAGRFYFRFCVIHVLFENPYIAISVLSFQDFA